MGGSCWAGGVAVWVDEVDVGVQIGVGGAKLEVDAEDSGEEVGAAVEDAEVRLDVGHEQNYSSSSSFVICTSERFTTLVLHTCCASSTTDEIGLRTRKGALCRQGNVPLDWQGLYHHHKRNKDRPADPDMPASLPCMCLRTTELLPFQRIILIFNYSILFCICLFSLCNSIVVSLAR